MSSNNQFLITTTIDKSQIPVEDKTLEMYDAASKSTASSPYHIGPEVNRTNESDYDFLEGGANSIDRGLNDKNKRSCEYSSLDNNPPTYVDRYNREDSKSYSYQQNHIGYKQIKPSYNPPVKQEKGIGNFVCTNCGLKSQVLQNSYCLDCFSFLSQSKMNPPTKVKPEQFEQKRPHEWLGLMDISRPSEAENPTRQTKVLNSQGPLMPYSFSYDDASTVENKYSDFRPMRDHMSNPYQQRNYSFPENTHKRAPNYKNYINGDERLISNHSKQSGDFIEFKDTVPSYKNNEQRGTQYDPLDTSFALPIKNRSNNPAPSRSPQYSPVKVQGGLYDNTFAYKSENRNNSFLSNRIPEPPKYPPYLPPTNMKVNRPSHYMQNDVLRRNPNYSRDPCDQYSESEHESFACEDYDDYNDEDGFSFQDETYDRSRESFSNSVNSRQQKEVPLVSISGINDKEDTFSFQGDRQEDSNGMQKLGSDFTGPGFGFKEKMCVEKKISYPSSKPKPQPPPLKDKKIEIIELLSEKSCPDEELEPENIETVAPDVSLWKLFKTSTVSAVDSNKTSEAKNTVDDIINYFMENSVKPMMQFHHEPLKNLDADEMVKTAGRRNSSPTKTVNNTMKEATTVKSNEQLDYEAWNIFKFKDDYGKIPKKSSKSLNKTKDNAIEIPQVNQGKQMKSKVERKSKINTDKLKKSNFHQNNKKRAQHPLIALTQNRKVYELSLSRQEEVLRILLDKQDNNEIIKIREVKKSGERLYGEPTNVQKGGVPSKNTERKKQLERLCVKKKKKLNPEESFSEESESSEESSEYFMFDNGFDIFLECYTIESDFVDIFEVQRRPDDFNTISNVEPKLIELENIIYPKKAIIQLGESHQASIPKLDHSNIHHRSVCKLWDPEKIERDSYNKFTTDISNLMKLPLKKISEEKLVETLVNFNYDTKEALKSCQLDLDYTKQQIITKKS